MKSELKNKLYRHYELAAKLKQIKKEEMALRVEIAEELFPTEIVGTFNKSYYDNTFDYHTSVTCTKKLNYKLDNKVSELLFDEVFQNCIKVSYSLRLKEYNELEYEDRAKIDEYLTVTNAAPTLIVNHVVI